MSTMSLIRMIPALAEQQQRGWPWWAWLLLIVAVVALVLLLWWLLRRSRQKETPVQAAAPAVQAPPRPTPVAPVAPVAPPAPAPVVATRAPAAPTKPDNLEIVEGIGPKISSILQAAGITTYAQLAVADQGWLQQILQAAGLRLADPKTWPQQARLAAEGKWTELQALQDSLKGGR